MQCQVLPFRQQKNNKMITSMLMNTPTKTHVSVWFSGQIRSVVIGRAVVINELFKKCNQTYRSQFQSSRNCKYSAYLLQNSTTTIKIRCSFLKGLHVLKLLMLITICSQLHSMFKKKRRKITYYKMIRTGNIHSQQMYTLSLQAKRILNLLTDTFVKHINSGS